jgi:hypothetical protein
MIARTPSTERELAMTMIDEVVYLLDEVFPGRRVERHPRAPSIEQTRIRRGASAEIVPGVVRVQRLLPLVTDEMTFVPL